MTLAAKDGASTALRMIPLPGERLDGGEGVITQARKWPRKERRAKARDSTAPDRALTVGSRWDLLMAVVMR